MRTHSPELEEVITGSHTRRLIADVFQGPDRVMQALELTEWEIDFDLTATVKMSGSATIAYQSVAGESLVPQGTEGPLSPFKSRLLLTMEISAGDFVELVTIGWARLVTAPSGTDYWVDTRYGRFVSASVVQIEFLGLDENVRRRGFRFPEQPPSLTSTYAELRRITGMTIVQTVADKAIPSGTTYETRQGGRLEGVQGLWDNLGCVGVINSTGAWVGVPKVQGAPVGSLVLGPDGTVLDVGYQADTDEVYNCVVGTFEDSKRNPIYVVAEQTQGALATSGPYEENTLYYSGTNPIDEPGAQAIVDSILTQSIGGQTYQVPISCVSNPLVEIGDVLTLMDTYTYQPGAITKPADTERLRGRLIKARMTQDAVMDVTLEVARSLQ